MPLEKQSLNNFLPNGFETLNQEGYKENFNEEKIKTGYEKDVPDIVSGPNLNNLIDVVGKNTNTLNNYVEYLNGMPINNVPTVNANGQLDYSNLNNKVNKSGDTMSGDLTIHDNQYRGMLFLQNKTLDYDNYVKPSETVQSGTLQFIDKNNQFYAFVQQQIFSDGIYNLSLGQRRKINGQDVFCNFESYINENGDCFCIIPNTVKIDGQWVYKVVNLLSNYTSPVLNDHNIIIDLSPHIPNDNYNYEVLLSCDAYTGSSSGSSCAITATGILSARIIVGQTRNNLAVGCGGSCIVPISTNRTLTIMIGSLVKPATIQNLWIEGYRRIGTNL